MLHQNNQNYVLNQNTIFINDLLINHTTIGTKSWETAIPQPVYIDLAMSAGIDNNFNHQEIITLLNNFCSQQRYESLQSLSEQLEQKLTETYPNIVSLEISIKQLFPASNIKSIGVNIARCYKS